MDRFRVTVIYSGADNGEGESKLYVKAPTEGTVESEARCKFESDDDAKRGTSNFDSTAGDNGVRGEHGESLGRLLVGVYEL